MLNLNPAEVGLIGTALVLVGGLLGWFGKGIGFLLTRRVTGSHRQERATYLNTVADLGVKLRSHGMTVEEVRQLEEVVQSPSIKSSEAASQVVKQLADDVSEPTAFHSNYAMKARTNAAYGVAEAKLEQALTDLQLLMGEHEWEHIKKAQEHWHAYRHALEDAALSEYEGGTHATLALAFVGMAETERRADEIRAQVEERARR